MSIAEVRDKDRQDNASVTSGNDNAAARRRRGRRRCLSGETMLNLADISRDNLSDRHKSHLSECVSCAVEYLVFRAAHFLNRLPSIWKVDISGKIKVDKDQVADECVQIKGLIGFDSLELEVCSDDKWLKSPLSMRVNVVIDAATRFFSITLLDVPKAIQIVGLDTPDGVREFIEDEPGVFVLDSLENEGDSYRNRISFVEFFDLFDAYKLQLSIGTESPNAKSVAVGDNVIDLLESHEAIERFADYELPDGYHTDTHINLAKVCSSPDSMEFVASKLDFLFWDVEFDAVMSTGWAMNLIGRRLADARYRQGKTKPIEEVMVEGYDVPILLSDILPRSRVLIATDVVVTGGLVRRLSNLIEGAGAKVAGIASVVNAHGSSCNDLSNFRTLCEIEMHVADPRRRECPRCDNLPLLPFNPVNATITRRSTGPVSSSDLLANDKDAAEFWRLVDGCDAYEHHRKEGDTHFIAFVNTLKLLEDVRASEVVIDKCIGHLADHNIDIFLVPNRARAIVFAKKLAHRLKQLTSKNIGIVVSRKHAGRWRLSDKHQFTLANRDVFILDTAAGHGRTIDRLAELSSRYLAKSIGATVIISRLTPSCERAFEERFDGRFVKLFHLPIRPVAIRGKNESSCPVCDRKNAIQQLADVGNHVALKEWAERQASVVRRAATEPSKTERLIQLELFESVLSKCRSSVASGIALHAIGKMFESGGTSFAMPELFDEQIPWRSRATMVENLPRGILARCTGELTTDLLRFLTEGERPAIWKSVANFMTREGKNAWVSHLYPFLERARATRSRTSESFWNHMAINVLSLAVNEPEVEQQLLEEFNDVLMEEELDNVAKQGINQICELLSQKDVRTRDGDDYL